MADVTRILGAIQRGDQKATDELLPIVYDELRKLAAQKLSGEAPGQTITASDLVHEVYLRLVGGQDPSWENRRHFFGAAAEAMRRILVDRARRKQAQKRGGDGKRVDLDQIKLTIDGRADELLILDEALERLAEQRPEYAELVKLRFFAGLTMAQAAEALGISSSTADNHWAYAKSWLRVELEQVD